MLSPITLHCVYEILDHITLPSSLACRLQLVPRRSCCSSSGGVLAAAAAAAAAEAVAASPLTAIFTSTTTTGITTWWPAGGRATFWARWKCCVSGLPLLPPLPPLLRWCPAVHRAACGGLLLIPFLPPPPPCRFPGGSQSRRVATVVALGGGVQAAAIPYAVAKAYLARHPLVSFIGDSGTDAFFQPIS